MNLSIVFSSSHLALSLRVVFLQYLLVSRPLSQASIPPSPQDCLPRPTAAETRGNHPHLIHYPSARSRLHLEGRERYNGPRQLHLLDPFYRCPRRRPPASGPPRTSHSQAWQTPSPSLSLLNDVRFFFFSLLAPTAPLLPLLDSEGIRSSVVTALEQPRDPSHTKRTV